ncbi:hypothetical protein [Streptomyces sp. NPDC002491]
MSFPEDPLGLETHLLLDGVWTRVTPAPYTRDTITHKRGRAYRATTADPATANATLKNVDGRYSPRNPEGPYYGQLTRNTPFRSTVPGGDTVHLDLTGAPDLATTPDAAALDITGDLDLRWEGEASWYEAGAHMLIGKWGAAGNRSYHLRIQDGALYLHITTDGTIGVVSWWVLPGQLPDHAALRATLDADNGASGYTVRLYWATTMAGPWTQFSSDLVGAGVQTIFASSAPLTIAPEQLDATSGPRRPVRGKVYKAEVRSGIGGTVVASPDFTAQPMGAGGSFTDSVGRVWTLAADAGITDRVTRFELEVPEWPAKWSTSEADAWTPIEASGILRRLSQGTKPLDSTLRRRIPSGAPLAYWPLEDGATATQFYSPTAGVRPLATAGMDLAADDSLAGSNALPTVKSGSTLSGKVPVPAGTATAWHTEFIYFLPNTGPATPRVLMQWLSTGTVRRWQLSLKTNGAEVNGYDVEGSVVASANVSLTSLGTFNAWTRWQLYATQSGGTVNWTVRWIPIGGLGGSSSDSYTGTLGNITGLRGADGGYSSDLDGVLLGHISVFATANTTIYNSADLGFAGETAAARMQRLCTEEGVPITLVGTASDTQLVGPQRPDTLLGLLRQAAETDGGILGESRDRGLLYRTRTDLYNQEPKLVLDYAAKEIAPPLDPVEDDQVRNEWSVQREGGSTALASLATGRLSIADIGYYPDSKTLALYSDDQTDQIAGWLLHLTTWDEARWPSVTLRLHRHPAFIPDVLGMDVGDKIRIENMPKRFAGGGAVELLVDSWEEKLRPRAWEITFNCAPAGPWDVAVADDAARGKLDTEGSAVVASVTDSATSLLVVTTSGPYWTMDPAQFPFDVQVAGEEMTVSAIAAENRDAFGRTVSGGWGIADSGLVWTAGGGTVGTDYAVGSGYGSHILTTTNASRRSDMAYALADVDVYVSLTTSATATGASLYGGPMGRYIDANNLYMVRVEFTTGNAILLDVRKRVAATESSLGTYTSPITHAPGTFVRCRLQIVGTAIRTKVWLASDPEPAGWHVDVVDTSLTTAVSVGCRSIAATGNTNSSPQVRYDNFEVINLQRFTVARSTNGVVKAQSVGEALRLAQSACAAL